MPGYDWMWWGPLTNQNLVWRSVEVHIGACRILSLLDIFVQFMPDGWHVFLHKKLSIQLPICFQPQVETINHPQWV